MRRLLVFILIASLFLPFLPSKADALIAVSSGSVSQANMRLSIVNGTALVDFSSAGALTNYIGYKLVITDSASKTLTGYIKAAGTGETLGTEVIDAWTNNGFETLTTSGSDITSAIETGANGVVYKSASLTLGGAYKLVINSYTLNSGQQAYIFLGASGSDLPNDGTWAIKINPTWTTPYTKYFIANTQIYHGFRCTDPGNWAASGISLKPLTTPSATGVTITSTANGSTYNWESETASFNRNDSSGYTYAIYPGTVNTTLSGGVTTGPILIDCADVAGTLGVDVTGTDTLLNYTIVRCPAGAIQATESCTIKNTIGISAGNDITIATGKTVTALNNLFGDSAKAGSGTYSDAGSTTKWSSDPLFVSTSDFHLLPGSPAINAGDWVGLTYDYDGNGMKGRPDIGAYEYQTGGGLGVFGGGTIIVQP